MKKKLLRELPPVHELLKRERLGRTASSHSLVLVTEAVRRALDEARRDIISGGRLGVSIDELESSALTIVESMLKPSVVRVVNASGTILHTNIGRAVLPEEAVEAVRLASGNVNLEFDTASGTRGERDAHVEGLIKKLTCAEAACVVNNNAAAVLIALNTLAEGREVIISRGELIEIGGSFRLPDVIRKSGCVLKEVGTTNRTHPSDYLSSIGPNTALIFKAHTSNFRIVGFTSEVGLAGLVRIAGEMGVPVVEDLGSGSLVDLSAYGLPKEPVVRESIEAGADIVTFSGDKLLGGPQAGIIAGKREIVDRIRSNPLKRALRADKLTIAALEATLRLYLNMETLPQRLPVLRFLARPLDDIERAAGEAAKLLKSSLGGAFTVTVEESESEVGGGALPDKPLKTRAVTITHETEGPDAIFRAFLENSPPILGRINKDRFILDMRTVEDPDDVVPKGLRLKK